MKSTTYTIYKKCNNCETFNRKETTACDFCKMLFIKEVE